MAWIEMSKKLRLGLPPRAPTVTSSSSETHASQSNRLISMQSGSFEPPSGYKAVPTSTTTKQLSNFIMESAIINVDEVGKAKRTKIVGMSSFPLGENRKLHDGGVRVAVAGGSSNKAKVDSLSGHKRHRHEPEEMDERAAKRLLSNRLYARKAWVRKQEFIADLEVSKRTMQAKVDSLYLEVIDCHQHFVSLQIENNTISQRIAYLMQEEVPKEAELRFLCDEKENLLRLFTIQQELLNDMQDKRKLGQESVMEFSSSTTSKL